MKVCVPLVRTKAAVGEVVKLVAVVTVVASEVLVEVNPVPATPMVPVAAGPEAVKVAVMAVLFPPVGVIVQVLPLPLTVALVTLGTEPCTVLSVRTMA